MKRLLLLIIYIFCFLHYSYSQNPLVKQWDYRFGSPEIEDIYSLKQTSDSGFILIGVINSLNSGGDVTDTSRGYEDMWVVKTDKFGIKEWDKRYGGTKQDGALDGFQTNDGGYIFVGYSFSDSGWEKSQNNWDTTLQTCDFWIVKTNSTGIKQWDKRFGGTNSEGAGSIIITNDGQYLIVGSSNSDANGDKSQSNQGDGDMWILKMDTNGNKIWDKRYGGNKGEYCNTIIKNNDNSYLLMGSSYSGISGDKTDNNRDSSTNTVDYWILKIDSLGNKQWDKTFGGNNNDFSSSALYMDNGDNFIFGSSKSNISGDRTISNYDTSTGFSATFDFWIIKIDSLGTKTGEKVFGGTSNEEFINVVRLNDGNFLLSGDSYSPASGDKTENNFGGPEETWIIKTDSNLVKLWDKTIFTISPGQDDEYGYTIQSFDGCIMIKNSTRAGIGGYKTQPSWGLSDYWIIKFCDSTATTSINTNSNFQIPISIYPNPANEFLVVSGQWSGKKEIEIYDLFGRTILQSTIYNLKSTIDISTLSSGIYFLKTGNEVRKFIKE